MSAAQSFLGGRVVLHPGDCRVVLAGLADASIDSVVTDPPYALVSIGKRFGKAGAAGVTVPEGGSGAYARASAGFMGQAWDTGETAFSVEFWAQVWRVLKPGGHVVAFGGTRSYHRLACAIEDAGFEIRDQLAWVYGSGFPKSHDVAKGIDKHLGHERTKVRIAAAAVGNAKARQDTRPFILAAQERGYHEAVSAEAVSAEAAQWQGWGTALKPAWEPIVLARKPLAGTVAETVVQHGTGALNIDGCRIGMSAVDAAAIDGRVFVCSPPSAAIGRFASEGQDKVIRAHEGGRWPANIVHDGSDEVVAAFPCAAGGSGKASGPSLRNSNNSVARGQFNGLPEGVEPAFYGDAGSAARFFYSAKADAEDRIGSKHPTVKPVDLMAWLCRMVTPPGGTVIDPFAGSGSTGEAAWREGFFAVLVEREPAYQADIARRLALAVEGPAIRKAERAKAKAAGKAADHGPLFGGDESVRGGGRQIYGHFADQDGPSGRSG